MVKVGVFQRGWATLSANFRWKGTSPSKLFWYQETRVITLSYGVKISAVYSFVSSQSTRVIDGRTDGQTNRQNYDSQDRVSIAVSRGKNWRRVTLNMDICHPVRKPTTFMLKEQIIKPLSRRTVENHTDIPAPQVHGWSRGHKVDEGSCSGCCSATRNASFQSANVLHMGSNVHLPASFRCVTTKTMNSNVLALMTVNDDENSD